MLDKDSFNSTLVRLKDRWTSIGRRGTTGFQFHTGSIKGARRAGESQRGQSSFNSTLVRLKVCPDPDDAPSALGGFNSTLVRLKAAGERHEDAGPSAVSIPHWFD